MKTPIFFINTIMPVAFRHIKKYYIFQSCYYSLENNIKIKYNNKKNIKSKNLYSPKKIKLKIKQFLYQDTKSN